MADKIKESAQETIAREIETLEIVLGSKITRSAATLEEYVQMRLAQGATLKVIRADLLNDLEEGGPIFNEFRNAIQPTFAGSVHRFRDIGEVSEIGKEDNKWRWVAVLVNTCPDCLKRHNDVKTWDEWESEGLPRSGVTVCGQNCKCVLLPERVAQLEPVKRS